MFGSQSVKFDKHTWTKLKRYADLAGYSSVDEFVSHLVEKELAKIDESESEDEIRKKLKGLGYLS
jgi:hypothetical protein